MSPSVPLGFLRVLIADDEPTVRETLVEVIGSCPNMAVVGTAGDAENAIDLAQKIHPDVALLGVRMPGGGGPRAAREIRRRSPDTVVVALSAYCDRTSVLEMLKGGAAAYLSKRGSADEIIAAIRRAACGVSTFSPGVATHVASGLAEQLEAIERESAKERTQVRRIKDALTTGQPQVVFQPVLDLVTGEAVGFEALARFRVEPEQGPDLWFAEAAAVGLLVDLELAAVRAALGHLDRIPVQAYLSVNASPDAVNSRRVQGALTAGPTERIVVEISEQASIRSDDGLGWSLGRLRDAGIRLCLDDAGAGLRSLRRIAKLKPDLIKLDLTLTRVIDRDETRQAIASLMNRYGSETGATIVAKGIETEGELSTLRSLGIRYGQGYYLEEPLPITDDRDERDSGPGSSRSHNEGTSS